MKQKLFIFLFAVSFMLEGGIAFAAVPDGSLWGKCIGGSTCDAPLVCQDGKVCVYQGGQGPQSVGQLFQILDRIVNWVFAVVILLSIMFVILAAFEFVTGGPEGVAKARQKLIWAAVGIGVAMLARTFPTIIRDFLS